MSDNYTENDIVTLSEVEAIRQNPGMFIGSTENPNHLLYEILDNALDEANNGFCDRILVSIDNKNSIYTVVDNGRGIPFGQNKIVEITSRLYSGGTFNKGSKNYKAAIGMHGVGLVAVNALSEWMEVVVYRDNKKVFYRFENFKVVKNTIEDFDSTKRPCSTCIKFKPLKKYFESDKIDVKPLRIRLELATVHIDKLRLISMADGQKEVIKMTMDDYFKKNYLGNTDATNHSPIFKFKEDIKGEELLIVFGWDMNTYSTATTGGSINVLPVQQGTHVNYTLTTFQNVFANIAKKEKLNYNPLDFKTGFRVFTSMQLIHTDFDSQTKTKFTSSKTKFDYLYAKSEKKIEEMLRSNEDVFNRIIYFIDSYRRSLTAKKAIVKNTDGKINRFNCSIDGKLRNCTSTDVSKCELYIVEGSSAGGGLIQCRDPRYHAVLGLRGKVLNLADPKIDYLKNKEFVEIINALGTGVGKDFDITKINYSKIIISTDADPDGSHIAVLLLTAFARMFPELIRNGYIYKAILPLYGVRNYNGSFLPFYSEEEMQKFKEKNPNVAISRYKGLGEMMPDQLAKCLIDVKYRRLQQLKSDEDFEPIFKMMREAESKRDLINSDNKEEE